MTLLEVFVSTKNTTHLLRLNNTRNIEQRIALADQHEERFLVNILVDALDVSVFGVQEENALATLIQKLPLISTDVIVLL